MTALTDEELSALRAPAEASSGLPPRAYTDPMFWRVEKERVFRTSWHGVGHVSQVANPGDYFTTQLLEEPIIIVRDRRGEVHALSNVCPHRWMMLAGHDEGSTFERKTPACGNRKSFQCPYHLWSFGLDGRMVGAPGMQDAQDFDKEEWSLPRFRVEIWQGCIFVNLDPDAEPLAKQLETLVPFLEAYELEACEALEPIEYECAWNWKMSVEAATESYHHLGLHVDLLEASMPAALSDIEPPRGPYSMYRNPTADGSAVPTAFPPPEGLSDRQRSCLKLVGLFPTTMIFLLPCHTFLVQIVANAHDHHRMRFLPLLHRNSEAHPDRAQLEREIRAQLDEVHQQDMAAGASVWRGVKSRHARPGRRSPLESQLWQFNNWVIDRVEGARP